MRELVRNITLVGILLFLIHPAFGEESGNPRPEEIRKMTLADAVFLALKNNLDLQSTFLDRIVQKLDLKVAEEGFKPQFSVQAATRFNSTADTHRTTRESHLGSFGASLSLPTGGSFSFIWDTSALRPDTSQDYTFAPSWSISYLQPLLRGSGKEVATATLQIARINEKQNILSLKNILMSTITATTLAFRSYLQAMRQLAISMASLEMGKRLYETNKALIAVGRLAATEIIQAEADIANRELALVSSENSVESARLALVRILNIDRETRFEPFESTEAAAKPPVLKEAIALAFTHRPDYRQALYDLETAKLNFVVAKNARLWDLSLEGGVGRNANGSSFGSALGKLDDVDRLNWSTGLVLTIPFGMTIPFRDLALERQYVAAKVFEDKVDLNLSRLRLDIEIEVENAIRDVNLRLRQVDISRQAKTLAEKKLEIENEKLKVGRTTNFQLITFQNDLVNAQNNELDSVISYLNALASLDQTLGTTLLTWKIEVKKEDETRGVLREGLKE